MRTLANSENPAEMPHYAAFHQGLHYLLWRKKMILRESENEIQFFLWGGFITCVLSIYTVDQPKFIVSNQKDESISA